MRSKARYIVRFSEMKEDIEEFEFHLEDAFFQDFSTSEWKSGDVDVSVHARKRADGITLNFELDGKIEVVCDRCLGSFLQEVSTNEQLFIKFGEEKDELDDNVIIVPKEENEIDIEHYIYEYLLTALPMQKMHPENADGSSSCDADMMQKLDSHLVKEDESTDPRWDELKKLKD